jgi:hypothetical protein
MRDSPVKAIAKGQSTWGLRSALRPGQAGLNWKGFTSERQQWSNPLRLEELEVGFDADVWYRATSGREQINDGELKEREANCWWRRRCLDSQQVMMAMNDGEAG